MKANIHPSYHEVTVRMTDGTEFVTSTTWGKPGETMILDVDTLTHNAWVGGKTKVNDKAGQVAKFNQRFAGINFGKKADANA
jgi:large subunit ribosomal protein L31